MSVYKYALHGVYVSDMKRTLIVVAVLTLMIVGGNMFYLSTAHRVK